MDAQQTNDNVRGLTAHALWHSFQEHGSVMDGASRDEWLQAAELMLQECDGWRAVTPQQGQSLEAFMWMLPEELRPETWGRLVMCGQRDARAAWAQSLHPYVVEPIVTGTFKVPVGADGKNVRPTMSAATAARIKNNTGVEVPADRISCATSSR